MSREPTDEDVDFFIQAFGLGPDADREAVREAIKRASIQLPPPEDSP